MRKFSFTTWSGAVAGTALAASQTPGISDTLHQCLVVAAAIAVVILGRYSSDCPPNCPGTDGGGKPIKPLVPITQSLPLIRFLVTAMFIAALVGCTTANRSVTTTFATAPDGTSRHLTSMTQSTSVRSLLTTVTGFSDSVTASGATHTAIGNYSADVNAINAIFAGLQSTIGTIAVAAAGTNATTVKNFLAAAGNVPTTPTQ